MKPLELLETTKTTENNGTTGQTETTETTGITGNNWKHRNHTTRTTENHLTTGITETNGTTGITGKLETVNLPESRLEPLEIIKKPLQTLEQLKLLEPLQDENKWPKKPNILSVKG